MTNRIGVFAIVGGLSLSLSAVEQVSPGNADDAAAINDAVIRAAGGDGKVKLADGTYHLTAPVALGNAVELIGNDADRTAVVLDGALNGTAKYRLMDISHNDALVHGVTFANGRSDRTDNYAYAPVYVSAGSISNCVCHGGRANWAAGIGLNPSSSAGGRAAVLDTEIYDCYGGNGGVAGIGGGLRLIGDGSALAQRCEIWNCPDGNYFCVNVNNKRARFLDSTVRDSTKGGIRVQQGLVSNCVVRACSSAASGGGIYINEAGYASSGTVLDTLVTGCSASVGGGVYVEAGTLRGCTVVGNTATASAAGVYQKGGAIENCVIWHNGSSSYLVSEPSLVREGGTCAYTCAQQAPSGNGNVNDRMPAFADVAKGDWTLTAASPCRGTGRGGVDMGCYPYVAPSSPRTSFTYPIADGTAPATTTFTAALEGDCGEVTGYAWDFGDGTTDTASGAEAEHTYTKAGSYTVRLTVSTKKAGDLTYAVTRAVNLGSTTVYVNPKGTGSFPYADADNACPDLATALIALVQGEGIASKLVLAPGTYPVTGPIALKANIELVGTDADRSQTVIDGQGSCRVIYTKHPKAFVHGVTIARGWTGDTGPFDGVAAFYSGSAFSAGGVFSNCTFQTMKGSYCSIGLSEGGVIVDCSVLDGEVTNGNGGSAGTGGGVKMLGGTLRRCEVRRCQAQYGGGLRVNGGLVDACTIDSCYAKSEGYGAVYQNGGIVSNCVISCATNTSSRGAYLEKGMMVGCLVTGNAGKTAAGAYVKGGTLRNCTVTANRGTVANGGVVQDGGAIENCIIAYNGVSDRTDDSLLTNAGTVSHTCAWTLAPAGGGKDANGNFGADPQFRSGATGDFRLIASSPCVDAGDAKPWGAGAVDLDGTVRVIDGLETGDEIVDIGAYEYDPASAPPSCTFEVTSGATAAGVPSEASFVASTAGAVGTVRGYVWTFGDGDCVTSSVPSVSHTYVTYGDFTVTLALDCTASAPVSFSTASAVTIKSPVAYVSLTGSNEPPYETPEKATPDINAAIGAVAAPGVVHVAAGTYTARSAQIFVNRAVRVVGDDGAANTVIDGVTSGDNVLWIAHADAVVEGLTLDAKSKRRGVMLEGGTVRRSVVRNGNAAWTASVYMKAGLIEACEISGGSSDNYGAANDTANGGVYVSGGLMCDCVVTNCRASVQGGGTINGGTVSNCLFVANVNGNNQKSGGVRLISGTLVNSRILNGDSDSAANCTAGVYAKGGTVRNCLIAGNHGAGNVGLWSDAATVENCTVAGNRSSGAASVAGVRCTGSTALVNVLGWDNVGASTNDFGNATVTTCLFSADPLFRKAAKGDYRLAYGSPARNAGTIRPWMGASADLSGKPRIVGRKVDIGCYECDASGLLLIVR